MHPADLEMLRKLRPVPAREEQARVELPKPMVKCPRDGALFPIGEGVCPRCGDFP